MAEKKGVRFVLSLEGSGFMAGMRKVENAFAPVNKALTKFGTGMVKAGRDMQQAGSKMTTNITLPMLALSAAALRGAKDIPEVKAALDGLKKPFQDVSAAVAGLLLPVLKQMAVFLNVVAQKIQVFSTWLRNTDSTTRGAVYALGLLLLAAGPVIKTFGLLTAVFGSLIKLIPILTANFLTVTAPLAAIAAMALFAYINFDKFRGGLMVLGGAVLYVVGTFFKFFPPLTLAIDAVGIFSEKAKSLGAAIKGLQDKGGSMVMDGLAEAGAHANDEWKGFGTALDWVKKKLSGFGSTMQSDVIEKLDLAQTAGKEFLTSFATTAIQSFSIFKQGSLDLLETFKSVIDQMVQKILSSAIIGLIGWIFNPVGSVFDSIGKSVSGGFGVTPGFDNPSNDRMARTAGQSKWFNDFEQNFSKGYVNSALQSSRDSMPAPSMGGGGGDTYIFQPMFSSATKKESRRFLKYTSDGMRRYGYA